MNYEVFFTIGSYLYTERLSLSVTISPFCHSKPFPPLPILHRNSDYFVRVNKVALLRMLSACSKSAILFIRGQTKTCRLLSFLFFATTDTLAEDGTNKLHHFRQHTKISSFQLDLRFLEIHTGTNKFQYQRKRSSVSLHSKHFGHLGSQ